MPRQTPGTERRWYRSDWFVVPCMLIMLLAARSSLADHYHVPSGSMEYTIMTGDRVFIDKTAYGFNIPFTHVEIAARGTPARGDVAVFDSPVDGTRLIKRIVAVAGDTVSLRDGLLSIDGVRLSDDPGDNPSDDQSDGDPIGADGADGDSLSAKRIVEMFGTHRAELNLTSGGGPRVVTMRVPEGKVLALGDHRGDSLDSRYFGLVDVADVYGRALGVYYRRGEGLTWRPL